MDEPALKLAGTGAEHISRALAESDLADLLAASDRLIFGRPGGRVFGDELVRRLCGPDGVIGRLAQARLQDARPVRAVLFDKTPANNWSVAWHQDRTIAVQQRRDVENFGPWSTKGGLQHVEPPFAVLEAMLTLRVHLDDCGPDNAPLLIVPGARPDADGFCRSISPPATCPADWSGRGSDRREPSAPAGARQSPASALSSAHGQGRTEAWYRQTAP